MDLGLKGRRALVCASSQGLGYACAFSLAREGAVVFINGRDGDKLEAARAKLIQETCAIVHALVADLGEIEGRASLLNAAGEIDILVNNNSGPPPGYFANWDEAAWLGAIQANMIPALMLIRGVLPGMQARKFADFCLKWTGHGCDQRFNMQGRGMGRTRIERRMGIIFGHQLYALRISRIAQLRKHL